MLPDRMSNLADRMNALASVTVDAAEARGFEARAHELEEPSQRLEVQVELVRQMGVRGIPVRLPAASAQHLKSAIDVMAKDYAGTPQSILRPSGTWRNELRKILDQLPDELRDSVSAAWSEFVRGLRPESNEAMLRILERSAPHRDQVAQMRSLDVRLDELQDRAPRSVEDFELPASLSEELRELWKDLPQEIPEAVRELLEAINSKTATLADVTPEVATWLADNELIDALSLSWKSD